MPCFSEILALFLYGFNKQNLKERWIITQKKWPICIGYGPKCTLRWNLIPNCWTSYQYEEECHMVLSNSSLWKSCLPFQITFSLWITFRLKCDFGSQVVVKFFIYQKRTTSAPNYQDILENELNYSLVSVVSRTFERTLECSWDSFKVSPFEKFVCGNPACNSYVSREYPWYFNHQNWLLLLSLSVFFKLVSF